MMTQVPSFNFTLCRRIIPQCPHTVFSRSISVFLSLLMKTDVLLMFSEDALTAAL